MRAVWYSRFGPAEEVLEVGELPAPSAAGGEVLVRVATSGINPVDVKRRLGGRGGVSAERVIPHFDGAGVIEAVGEGVSADRIGERVWLYEAQWGSNEGSAAEWVTVRQELAVPLSSETSFAEGAALGIPALTAHRCVLGDGPVEGRTILVTGGAGAVGGYAVQFAALSGARVIATVSGAEKAEVARAGGAHHVLNYRQEDVAARVDEITDGDGVDRIVEVEFGGNLATTLAVLKPRGVVSTYASEAAADPEIPFYALLYKNVVVRFELVFGMSEAAKRQAVGEISRWLEDGKLRHHAGPSFPLEEAAAAHRAVEQGAFGKVIIRVADLD